MVLGFWRIERALPEWLGVPQIQWVVWAYAVFQLLRKNNCFLFIISWFVTMIKEHIVDPLYSYFYGRVPVVVRLIPHALRLQEPYEVDEGEFLHMEDGDQYFQRHPPKTFRVVPRDESWPSDWRVVEFNRWHYITTKSALDTMATWISRRCEGDDGEALFTHKVDDMSVDERISREEAYEKMFSGSYLISAYDGFPSAISYMEMNGKLWGVLSTIPVLLQAWNYNRTSTLSAFVIILLDFFRSVVNNIYRRLYLNIRVFVKSKLTFEPIKGNRCLEVAVSLTGALLGLRWFPTRYPSWQYVAEQGMELRVYPNCKVKSVEDVITISGNGYYTSDETYPVEEQIHVYDPNHNPMLMLWGKRAVIVRNLSHPPKVQFGIATLKRGIVVERSL